MLLFLQATEVVAETAQAAPSSNGFYIMIALMFLVMWLLIWRPESKRRKQAKLFRESLQKGQKVMTAGGIYGTIKEVKDNYVLLEIDNNVHIRIDRNMVSADSSAASQTPTAGK